MDHQNVSISGSENEPFYDLLQSNSTMAPSSSNSTRTAQHRPIMWEVPSAEFNNNDEDLLSGFDSHPTPGGSSSKTIDTASLKKVEDSIKKVEDNLFPPSGGRQSSTLSSSYTQNPKVHEPVKSWREDGELYDSVTVAAVECTVKKYADNILHVLEGMSARLLQLEATAQRLDYSFEGLRKVGGENHGDIDRRLRKVEESVKEVQTWVKVLHDKQETTEDMSQFLKPQLPHNAYIASTSGVSNISDPDGPQQPRSEVPLHHHMPSPSPVQPPLHLLPPSPTAPSPPQSQTQHSQLHATPHPQQPLPPVATANVPSELAHHPVQQQPFSPSPQQRPVALSLVQQPPSHVVQSPPSYPQQPQLQHVAQGSYGQQLETPSYISVPPVHHPAPPASSNTNYGAEFPQYLPGNYVGPPSRPPPEQMLRPPPALQQAAVGHVYEPASGRTGSGPMPTPGSYLPQPQALHAAPSYEYKSGGYGSPSYKVAQPVPSAPSGGSSYPRLPTAQPLQHALPASDGGSGTSGSTPLSTNRVPIDEVIEKVSRMGFPRDQVRSVVRRLTENGQSVDLNVVLDKLMNGENQAPKGWFGR